jgi:hypothetical protein
MLRAVDEGAYYPKGEWVRVSNQWDRDIKVTSQFLTNSSLTWRVKAGAVVNAPAVAAKKARRMIRMVIYPGGLFLGRRLLM